MTPKRVQQFDWAALPRLSAGQCELLRRVSGRIRAEVSQPALTRALTARLGEAVSVHWGPWGPGQTDSAEPMFAVQLPSSGWILWISPERELVRLAVARLLAQPFQIGVVDAPLDPALWGAAAAVVLDVARQCVVGGAPILRLAPSEVWQSLDNRLVRRGAVHVGERAYRLDVAVDAPELADCPPVSESAGAGGWEALAGLGGIALRVPWVVAVSSATLLGLSSLSLGDVWLPGEAFYQEGKGFTARAQCSSGSLAGCLAAAGAEWGWPVSGRPDHFVLGQAPQRLPLHGDPEVEAGMAEDRSGLGDVLAQAQVLVRVELGAVEMRANQWAQLRPGDVVQTGRSVGAAVQLRAGGELLAEGQLVEVDGQLGVRVERLAGDTKAGVESGKHRDTAPTASGRSGSSSTSG